MINKKATPLMAILTAVALSACVGEETKPAPAADAAQVKAAITAAEASVEKAGSVGYEWRDSGKLLDQARKALEAGDNAKAAKLAEQARRQGELAHAQYLSQKDILAGN